METISISLNFLLILWFKTQKRVNLFSFYNLFFVEYKMVKARFSAFDCLGRPVSRARAISATLVIDGGVAVESGKHSQST